MPFKCPPAPYEAAMLAKAFLDGRGVRANVTLASPEPQPLPVAGPECGATVREWLTERGVEVLSNHKPVAVHTARKEVRFENGATRRYDLLAAVPPHRAPQVLHDAGLVNEAGWVPVDARTLATRHPGVWAIGDCNVVKLANGKPLVKAGIMAEGEGITVARNIASRVRGEPEGARFDAKGGCFLELGGGLAVEVVGDFYATPDPIVAAQPPSRASLEAKKRFESERIARWLGA
jgi:sulfide:quinone oxidoreductase